MLAGNIQEQKTSLKEYTTALERRNKKGDNTMNIRLVVTAEDAKVEYEADSTEAVVGLRIISSVIHAESENYSCHIDGKNKTIRIETKNPVSIRTYTADTPRALINELSKALNLL